MPRISRDRATLDEFTSNVQKELRDTRDIWNIAIAGDSDLEWCRFIMDMTDEEGPAQRVRSGRRDDRRLMRIYLVMLALEIPSVTELRRRLEADEALREACTIGERDINPAAIQEYLRNLGQHTAILREHFNKNMELELDSTLPERRQDQLRAVEAAMQILEWVRDDALTGEPPHQGFHPKMLETAGRIFRKG